MALVTGGDRALDARAKCRVHCDQPIARPCADHFVAGLCVRARTLVDGRANRQTWRRPEFGRLADRPSAGASNSQAVGAPDAIHPHGQLPFGGLAMASYAPRDGVQNEPLAI